MSELIQRPSSGDLTFEQQRGHAMVEAGQVANRFASDASFEDYKSRQSTNTLKTQKAALDCFALFLAESNLPGFSGAELQTSPLAWHGVTWGIVSGFVKWMLNKGYAVATINNRLSTVRVYAELAGKAGEIPQQEIALIQTVKGYAGRHARHIDEKREAKGIPTRNGRKKASHTPLSNLDRERLKTAHDDTPQGRRDRLLMCILLDHGLRASEVSLLTVDSFDLEAGTLTFYRPKVGKTQTHRLSEDTTVAASCYIGRDVEDGPVMIGSKKDSGLRSNTTMSANSLSRRVRQLATEILGNDRVSSHDGRHKWATMAAQAGNDMLVIQEAGGWTGFGMVRRYVDDNAIANEGLKLG